MQLALFLLQVVAATTRVALPTVVPAVVYNDHIFVHQRDTRWEGKPYVIVVWPLTIRGGITYFAAPFKSRHGFESLFVREKVLVVSGNTYSTGAIAGFQSTDEAHYLSADRICEAKWIYVEPTGEPVKYAHENGYSIMWYRERDTRLENKPGDTEIHHTAIAPLGKRKLLAFDLLVTEPFELKPTPKPVMVVTEIVPEDRARTDEFLHVGDAEERKLESIHSPFTDAFQAYVIGDDYFFLTKSGMVYRAPPAAKGKSREMVLWSDPQERVSYVISDGNQPGVHFLVTARNKTGWHYYRLGPEPKRMMLSKSWPNHDKMEPLAVVFQLAKLLKAKNGFGSKCIAPEPRAVKP